MKVRLRMTIVGLAVAAPLWAAAAAAAGGRDAASVDAEPSAPEARVFGDFRLRYEHASDDARPLAGDALTARLRLALEASPAPWLTGLAEFEGAAAPVDRYDDLVGTATDRAVIADPGFAELNRLFARASWADRATVTVGRQHLSLDDERFLGRVAFRQNEQTVDAARLEVGLPLGVDVEAAYVWGVNRILSARNDAGRFRGDSAVVNVSAGVPYGRVVGFYYALDLETGPQAAPNASASSRTRGVRWEGRAPLSEAAAFQWEASWARQDAFAGAPLAFEAEYWLGAAAIDAGPLTFGARFEVLGRGGAQAFQTPLATLHAFQGAADVFLSTPVGGLRETAIRAEWRAGQVGPLLGVAAFASGHRFEDGPGAVRYGWEVDGGVRGTFKGVGLSFKFARYEAETFAADVQRFWLTAEQAF